MLIKFINKLFNRKKKDTKPRDYEWERFEKTARQQFIRLKEKGLSIPVMTL